MPFSIFGNFRTVIFFCCGKLKRPLRDGLGAQ